MDPQEIDVRRWTTAPPEAVWALLEHGRRWPDWSPLDAYEPGCEAPEGGEGVGAERTFRTGRTASRERLVAYDPGHGLSYELLSGLPLDGYRADVTLTPERGGTTVRWHSTFRGRRPGTGWLYRLALRRFIRQMVEGLVAAAEAGARAAAVPPGDSDRDSVGAGVDPSGVDPSGSTPVEPRS